jgi:hypothetical protein
MNSLYGRFGMKDELDMHVIIDENDTMSKYEQIFANDKDVAERISLGNGKSLLTIRGQGTSQKDISIGIAAAVTAYARVDMSHFLMNINLNILYTDTDSIYLTIKLASELVSNKLGA